jgi:hypothetical protein
VREIGTFEGRFDRKWGGVGEVLLGDHGRKMGFEGCFICNFGFLKKKKISKKKKKKKKKKNPKII